MLLATAECCWNETEQCRLQEPCLPSGCRADLALTLGAPRSLVSARTMSIGRDSPWDSYNVSRLPPKHEAWEFAGSLEQRLLGQEHPIYPRSVSSGVPRQPCTCQESFDASLVI